jgi:peroxiredoxin
MMADAAKLKQGDTFPAHTLTTITGEKVDVPAQSGPVHMQLRRFAGCPICELHLHTYSQRVSDVAAAGVKDVVVFHSTDEDLRKYEADLPFLVVGDPDKELYRELGVESAPRALLNPRVLLSVVPRAAAKSFSKVLRRKGHPAPLGPHGGTLGLPADFLVAPDGKVMAAKYGEHAYDQWSADEVIALARV